MTNDNSRLAESVRQPEVRESLESLEACIEILEKNILALVNRFSSILREQIQPDKSPQVLTRILTVALAKEIIEMQTRVSNCAERIQNIINSCEL